MNKSNILTGFAIIFAVMLTSGCIQQGSVSPMGSAGRDSLKLAVDTEGRTSFVSMEPFLIALTAENTGDFDVTDVETALIGYDAISPQEKGKSLAEPRWMADILNKPNQQVNTLGGAATAEWDVYAPFVSEDSPDVEVVLTGEVFYRTKSFVKQALVVAEYDYIKALNDRSQQLPAAPATEAKNGPVSITIIAPDPYVEMVDDTKEFSVKVAMSNDGSGNIYGRWGGGMGDYNYLERLTLEVPEGLKVDADNCDFVAPAGNTFIGIKTLVIDDSNNRGKLRLLGGGYKRELFCRLIADSDYVNGYNTFQINAEAEYSYLQDITRKLIITGSEEKPIVINPAFPTGMYQSYWEQDTGNEAVFFNVKYKNQQLREPGDIEAYGSIAAPGVDASQEVKLANIVFKPKGKKFTDVGASCVPPESEYTADETKAEGFIGCVARPVSYLESSDGPFMFTLKVTHAGEEAHERMHEAVQKILD